MPEGVVFVAGGRESLLVVCSRVAACRSPSCGVGNLGGRALGGTVNVSLDVVAFALLGRSVVVESVLVSLLLL